jgi:stress-induced morphogen
MSCTDCKARFSPFTRQYGCPKCGLAFCSSCRKHSITLQDKKDPKLVKVCLSCHAKHTAPPQPVSPPAKERQKMATLPVSEEEEIDGYTVDYIKKVLEEKLAAEHVEVVDTSLFGRGGEYAALIVSTKFEGKALLARQKIVNSALEEELKTIHTFSQKTFTPGQWSDFGYKDPTYETEAKFAKQTVDQIGKLVFENDKTKFSQDALSMTTEMLRIYVLEAAHSPFTKAMRIQFSTTETF